MDTGGRVDKFRKRFGDKSKIASSEEEITAPEEPTTEEVASEESVSKETVTEDLPPDESQEN